VINRSVAMAAASLILVAVSAGTAQAASSRPSGSRGPLFGTQPLLPGQSAHATITLPAAQVVTKPYLQIADFQQGCARANCTAARPRLARVLLLTVTDSDDVSWTSRFARLVHRRDLPGGTIAAGQDRTYQLTLSLPASAGNGYESLGFSASLRLGGTDGSTSRTTITLGKPGPPGAAGASTARRAVTPGAKALLTLGRPGPSRGDRPAPIPVAGPSIDDSVPFTGFDAFAAIVFAAEILGFSTLLAAAARRRRRRTPNKEAAQ
jgi:hypothetical protein